MDGKCVPTPECLLFSDPTLGEQCCNVDYSDGVDSPDACLLICSSAGGRADFEWCCDGTVRPPSQHCNAAGISLTQNDLDSMLKTLGVKL